MKSLAKYLLIATLFAGCKNVGPDPNIAIQENAHKVLIAHSMEYITKDTAGAKLDSLILVRLDTLTNSKATQYYKELVHEKYALYNKLYKATENLITAQKDIHKWVAKDMRPGTVIDETDNEK